jgi:hypothetical protein
MIQETHIKYTAPQEFNMIFDQEDQPISILVGQNGTGKTMMLIHRFMVSSIINAILLGKMDPTEATQEVFSGTLNNPDSFSGSFKLSQDGCAIRAEIEDGKVLRCEFENPHNLEKVDQVVYMSTSMRLFNEMDKYLKLRKQSAGDDLIDFYRLYDIAYMERLISACPVDIPETIEGFWNQEPLPTVLKADFDKGVFTVQRSDGTEVPVTSYGNGHQAILNMLVGMSL